MRIIALETKGYRNLKNSVFQPGEGLNILCGENGQGKTNLLESLWLFTGEKSFRGAGSHEMIQIGGQNASLLLCFEARGTRQDAKLELGTGRLASLNGIGLESPAKLAGIFCAVVFSPDHLGLIKEGPRIRRHFLDAAICQLWPRHAAAVCEYDRALTQRNALLKDIPSHAELLDTLPVWDEKLAAIGAMIQFARLRYLRRAAPAAARGYDGIAGGGEPLGLSYLAADGGELEILPDESPEACRRRLANGLLKIHGENLRQDVERGFTSAGPHRDELFITVDGLSARLYGSQGQQRSAVLALKLAEAEVLQETIGEPPVLLLDDVMSELDRARQEYLLSRLKGYQIFITFCDPSGFAAVKSGRVFTVREGVVSPRAGAQEESKPEKEPVLPRT